MNAANDFTPFDFLRLVKDLNEHEGEMKLKAARTEASSRVEGSSEPDQAA